MSATADFDTRLLCVRCGQEGRVTWARDVAQHQLPRTATSPIATSDGFYLRMNRNHTSNPQIVCTRCGTVQRDWVA